MKQSSKRFTSMIITVACLVAALIVFFDLLEPAYGDLEAEKGKQVSDAQFLASEQQIVTQAKNLLTQYQNETSAQANLALAMPSGPDVAGALAQIYGIASANGLSIGGINVTAPTIQLQAPQSTTPGAPLTAAQLVKPVGTLTFQIIATGSYESMKAFLQAIESNLRIFDTTNFALQPTPSTGAKGVFNADMFTYNVTITTYYQSP